MSISSANRTLRLSRADRTRLATQLLKPDCGTAPEGVACDHSDPWAAKAGIGTIDLLFLDPPYNRDKGFASNRWKRTSAGAYARWLDARVRQWLPALKPTATIYLCSDWETSPAVHEVASRYFRVRNRITWEREKGRGSLRNWKNNSEDIWYCTAGSRFTFHAEAVKSRRPVVAPYRDSRGKPRDWQENGQEAWRDTFPSNFWSDVTVPFWSMPENTGHPAQKSEKLVARLILASTDPGDYVVDPFAGSGTTGAVCRKLGRRSLGIEREMEYALLALCRLERAAVDPSIQGYYGGVFWPRNGLRRVRTRVPVRP